MRTPTKTTLALALVASSALGACKWTEFDDIASETWVDSTKKPDSTKSSDYGVAIQRGDDATDATSSGTIAVIGAGPGSYSELLYNSSGSASLKTNSLQLAEQGIMALDSPPILLASPTSAEVALVTTGDTSSIVVATGTHTLLVRQLFVNTTNLGPAAGITTTPDAATYMQPAAFPGGDASPTPAPLVGVGDIVMGTIYNPPQGSKQPACKLTDGTNPIQIRALGAVKAAGATDDFLVWNGADGKLLRYDGAAFNGCTTAAPTKSTDMNSKPVFVPGHGSQILAIDATHVLLQGHEDLNKGNASFLQVYDVTTMMPVGMPITAEGVRQAAVLTTAGGQYAIAGYPGTIIDGTTTGAVQIYKLAPGFDSATPVATLHDAQPDNNQLFGRAVAAMPFNGKQVIAVAADNEIFMYFRANQADGTPLYDETRQGK